MEEDSIEISWLPPDTLNNIPLNYTVAYTTISDVFSRTTETITQSQSWKIRGEQGDAYSVTVTPQAESGEGESATISVGIDCKLLRSSQSYFCMQLNTINSLKGYKELDKILSLVIL